MSHVDLCIFGGGPAGLALAILGAREGMSVTLVERDGYLRPRAGEHFSGEVRHALDALDIPRAEDPELASPSAGIVSIWGSRVPVTQPYAARPGPAGLTVNRARFDEMLFEHAGRLGVRRVMARQNTLARENDLWRVSLSAPQGATFTATTIVDATGRRAAVARSQGAGRVSTGDLFAMTLWLEDEGVAAPLNSLVVEAGRLGWWSLCAAPGTGHTATFYTSRKLMRSLGFARGRWALDALPDAPYIANTLVKAAAVVARSRVFPCFPSRADRMFGPGWVAIGDAATAYDPICGRGVEFAMMSAFRAFEAILADPQLSNLGPLFQSAMTAHHDRHLVRRCAVYHEAGGAFHPDFLASAVDAERRAPQPNSIR
ncbi:MAG: NAD(P)/FAD-dependent oxidoreductase [Pseudomonadota bacterium]